MKDPVHQVGSTASGTKDGWVYSADCKCGWRVTTPTFQAAFRAEADHLHEFGLQTREEQMAARDVVHVFSNGSEFRDWESRNCDRCTMRYDDAARDWRCPLEKAIGNSMWDEDSAMDRELAIRAGLHPKPKRDCPEQVRDWSVS